MTHTSDQALPAPLVNRHALAYLVANPDAAIVQSLRDGVVRLHTDPRTDPFDDIEVVVLLTFEDAMQYCAQAKRASRTGRLSLAAVEKVVNRDLLTMHARGEFPTLADVESVVAEMAMIDALILPFSKEA
jgi:hypothetical protein